MNRRSALITTGSLLLPPWLKGCTLDTPTPASSEELFLAYAAEHGWHEGAVDASLLTSTAIGFFKEVPIKGLAPEDGDQLLFQWGTYDWGHGASFEFDITRQFITAGAATDAAVSHLRVTAHYQSTPGLTSIKSGNAWCKSKQDSAAFEQLIRKSSSFAGVQAITPTKVSVSWGPV